MRSVLAFLLVGLLSGTAWAGHRPPPAPPVTGMVNLNTATQAQLELLPGVGASRAKAILAYRSETPFSKVDDLRKVKGIGRGVLQRVQGHVSVSGATTIAKAATVQARTAPAHHAGAEASSKPAGSDD